MGARFSAADYAGALTKLLPRGRVWPREAGSTQAQVVACFAPTMERVDASAVQLLADAFPGTTINLLDDWEASLGLPDPCLGNNPTMLQRRAQVVSRVSDSGGQSAQRFIDLAAQLGFVIEIITFAPFRTGRSRVGGPLNSPDWSFAWRVRIISGETGAYNGAFRAGQGRMGDPLASTAAGLNTLFCELRRVAPAHTILLL
ncbi:YmfQ family protein [Sphingomonas sp. UYP23]